MSLVHASFCAVHYNKFAAEISIFSFVTSDLKAEYFVFSKLLKSVLQFIITSTQRITVVEPFKVSYEPTVQGKLRRITAALT